MKKILLLFAVCAICSCSGRFEEDAIRDTTSQFFTSIQSKNLTLANRIYPNFSKIASVHNFINYTVESMNYEKGKGVCVNVDLEYLTSRTAPASHYKVKFYFEKDKETKSYFIKDSESFAVFDRDAYNYKYAVKTGCLDELKDVTDVMISDKLAMAQEMYNYYFEKIKEEVKTATTISKSRERAFGWYDYLRVKVSNDSKYDLHNLRYNASWRWKDGSASENYNNKKLFQKNLKTGQWVEFNPYNGDEVRNDAIDKFDLIFDDAVHYILQNEITYQGDEYAKYLQEVKETAKSE